MRDKVIVITGASGGIGASAAERAAARGAKVVLAARREAELKSVAEKCGKEALAVVCDVTKRADVERLVRPAIDRFGAIDVLVNNAGRGISRMPTQLTDDDIDEMMLVNVKSVLYGMQAVLPHFRERKRGHIVNVSSLLGRVPFAPIRSAYSASKHFMNCLTACMRMELRGELPDVHVSLVSPGIVATEFGINAKHGGFDSRQAPGAQPVEEVADVILDVIERPRADVYTRPGQKETIVAYYAADDMGDAESKFAHMGPPRRP